MQGGLMSKKRFFLILITTICPILFCVLLFLWGGDISRTLRFILFVVSIILSIGVYISLFANKVAIAKLFFVIVVLYTLLLSGYLYFYHKQMLSIFYSVASFRQFILSTGNMGIITYILIQACQVVILPVPAAVIAIAGGLIYGPFIGGLYCSAGVLIGSNISYAIGRFFGFRVVSWISGESNVVKYSNILNNKGKLFLPMAFLLPMFPDDILCLIAGLTRLDYKFFFVSTTITRPISVICMCYFGGGFIIPFKGWGIPVWIVLALIISVVVVCTYKYQEQIENWILSKIKPKKKKHQ